MSRAADRGFILATTLLVMTMLTVMLTAALITIAAEYRSTNGSYGTSRALNFAQAGLQSYLSVSHSLSGTSDSVNYTFSGGYARVVARRMHDSTSSLRQLWIIYSTGLDTSQNVSGSGARTVAQLAYLETGLIPLRAAMVAINGDSMLGTWTSGGALSNPIDGDDASAGGTCSPPGGGAADTFGLTVPAGLYFNGGPANPSKYDYPDGEGTNGMEVLSSPAAVLDSTRIDWVKVTTGAYTPDYIGSWPTAGASTYNTHYFSGNATMPSAGSSQMRGVLLVEGNLTLSNNSHWDGIILVGGRLVATVTNYTIHGSIITGLSYALGTSVPKNLIQRNVSGNSGTRRIFWDYCYTRSTFGSQHYFTPIAGTFTDSWDTY